MSFYAGKDEASVFTALKAYEPNTQQSRTKLGLQSLHGSFNTSKRKGTGPTIYNGCCSSAVVEAEEDLEL